MAPTGERKSQSTRCAFHLSILRRNVRHPNYELGQVINALMGIIKSEVSRKRTNRNIKQPKPPAAVRRVPPGLLGALPVHDLGALGIVVVVRDVGPRQSCAMMSQMRLTSPDISANAPITKTSTRPPLCLLSAVTICPSEPGGWPLSSSILAARLR